jgi:hypothetical protein
MQDDFERIWKEVVHSLRYLLAGTEEIREIPLSGYPVLGTRFDGSPPEYKSRELIHISLKSCILDMHFQISTSSLHY